MKGFTMKSEAPSSSALTSSVPLLEAQSPRAAPVRRQQGEQPRRVLGGGVVSTHDHQCPSRVERVNYRV